MQLLPRATPQQQVILERPWYHAGHAAAMLALASDGEKTAGDLPTVHALQGRLYLSSSGWLLLSVPNALGRGAFDALAASGAELPSKDTNDPEATYNAHISVMSKDEVATIGPNKLTERGHMFHYTLGPIKEVHPQGWDDVSKAWLIEVQSPELKALRKSYGLPPLPHGDHEFHITFAVRRKKVLQNNDVPKFQVEYSRGTTMPVQKAAALLTFADIDAAAAMCQEPKSDEQAAAGNYRHGHCRLHGMPITIETGKGMTRSGTAKNGRRWSIEMAHHYGYIKQTESEADGDHIDVFIGPDPESEVVFVIDQLDPESGKFDEHKCMLGFKDKQSASDGYLACYDKGWKGLGTVTSLTIPQFKEWLAGGKTGKPLAGQKLTFKQAAWDDLSRLIGPLTEENHAHNPLLFLGALLR